MYQSIPTHARSMHIHFKTASLWFACFIPLLVVLTLISSCGKGKSSSPTASHQEVTDFEKQARERRTELIYNHTYDKANLPIADSIYAEAERLNSDYGRMVALQIRYYVYVADSEMGDEFTKAIDEFLQLAKKAERIDDYYDAMNAKVHHLMEKAKYMAALYMVKDVLKEAEKTNDPLGLYFSNYMMANVYQGRDNFRIAIPYLQKAAQYAKGDSLKTAIVYRELSVAYINTDKYDKALETADVAKRFAPTTVHQVWAEHQYLTSLVALHKYKEFADCWDKSYIRTHDVDGILPNYMQLNIKSDLSLCKGNYDDAIKYVNEIEYPEVRNKLLLKIYHAKGDYQKVFEVRNLIDEEKDSLQTAMQIDDLSEMDARLGNSMLKMQSEQLKQHNQLIISVGIILLLLIISISIGVISYRNRKHMKELNAKNKELMQANELAEAASEAKSLFIRNMSHELNTPLNHVYGFAQLIVDDETVSTPEEYKEMAQYICDGSEQLKNLIENITEVSSKLSKLTKLEEVESVLHIDSEQAEE